MYKIIGYTQDGDPIYGDIYGQPFQPEKDVVITAKKNTTKKWYEGVFENAGGILSGAGTLISSIKGNPGNVTYVNTPTTNQPKSKDNTIIYAAIAIIGLILIFFFINKK